MLANGFPSTGNNIHVYARREGICGCVIADQEYDGRVAQLILGKISDEFLTKYPRTAFANAVKKAKKEDPDPCPFPELAQYIDKYQDPSQVDSIFKIQQELAETKIVIHKTIESMLERGEKIDSLVAKSDGLSAQSKMFYTQVRYFTLAELQSSFMLIRNAGEEAELLLRGHVND